MFWMTSHITIGNFVFKDTVHSVKIESSRKTFGNRATIQLANLEGRLDKDIQYGAPVVIQLGYVGYPLQTEFVGYVASVKPSIPMEVICEDEMYQFKRQAIEPKSWASVTLKALLNYIAPEATVSVNDITLSPFRIDKSVKSRAEALQKIKDEFGLDVYFRGKQLFVGIPYSEQVGDVYHSFYYMDGNRASANAKMDSLEFKRKEDIRILIKAISINQRNEKIEAEVGDKDGETHTLHFYNLTKAELEQMALSKIGLMKYSGYKGKFKGFGLPFATHGMVEHLHDGKHEGRKGDYFIDSVTTTYDGSGGYKRDIELGRRSA
jgi:phage protein D